MVIMAGERCPYPSQLGEYSGADPGFWERGGLINIFTTWGGMPPPVTESGAEGTLIAPPVGSGAKPSRFLLLHAFI